MCYRILDLNSLHRPYFLYFALILKYIFLKVAGEVRDHGTHVCGSIMGLAGSLATQENVDVSYILFSCYSLIVCTPPPKKNYKGVAYEARVDFFDIGEFFSTSYI